MRLKVYRDDHVTTALIDLPKQLSDNKENLLYEKLSRQGFSHKAVETIQALRQQILLKIIISISKYHYIELYRAASQRQVLALLLD